MFHMVVLNQAPVQIPKKYEGCSLNNGTIHPGLRLLPSGNFFLALNRSHHFLLKKSEFNTASWGQWFKLNNFGIHSQYFQQCKIIKIESLCWSCNIEFWLFLTKNDGFYLKPKRNYRMAQAWDQGELSPWQDLTSIKCMAQKTNNKEQCHALKPLVVRLCFQPWNPP